MITKISVNGWCQVSFLMQPEQRQDAVWLCGDFNGWHPTAHPMERCRDGSFARTILLSAGETYRFRYRLADGGWENDWGADGYVPSERGHLDSVVAT
jgi:1,4-alpha-glucan branching enzyme